MHISYNIVGGIEYGTVTNSIRTGRKAGKDNQIYLGRVTDRERGIFKSRERGLFVYDIETNTFHPVPADYEMPKIQRKKKYTMRPTLIVSFGDIFSASARHWLISEAKMQSSAYKGRAN